jgi:hypothetical protein
MGTRGNAYARRPPLGSLVSHMARSNIVILDREGGHYQVFLRDLPGKDTVLPQHSLEALMWGSLRHSLFSFWMCASYVSSIKRLSISLNLG